MVSFVVIIIGFCIYLMVDHLTFRRPAGSPTQSSGMMDLIKDPVLAGKLMRAGSDPSALKNLTSKEKQTISSLRTSVINSSKDQGLMGMMTQLVGDSSLAGKLARAKGDPSQLKNLSAAEKQKLKELKNSLPASEIQNLKTRYGNG